MVPNGYYAILTPDEGGILVQFPQHPGINTFGQDWEHAEEMAQEALSLGLEADFERGYTLPPLQKPRVHKGQRLALIRLDADLRMAYLLRAWRESAGFSQKEIAIGSSPVAAIAIGVVVTPADTSTIPTSEAITRMVIIIVCKNAAMRFFSTSS